LGEFVAWVKFEFIEKKSEILSRFQHLHLSSEQSISYERECEERVREVMGFVSELDAHVSLWEIKMATGGSA